MKYIFDTNKIKELITDFYTATGISITVYDTECIPIAASDTDPPYCVCVRADKERLAQCEFSDVSYLKAVGNTKTPLCYTCHAGIMEMVTPILYEDTIIAYLQIGQFRDEEEVYASHEKVREYMMRYGISDDSMYYLYDKLPVVSQKKLRALTNMIATIIKSFWIDRLIYPNHNLLSLRIEQYISEHLREKLSVEEICCVFFLSKNALYRLFSTEFNMPIHKYILQKRINLAKELLLSQPNKAIAQISEDCGFSDYNYFTRAFHRICGITPLKYRKSNIK